MLIYEYEKFFQISSNKKLTLKTKFNLEHMKRKKDKLEQNVTVNSKMLRYMRKLKS